MLGGPGTGRHTPAICREDAMHLEHTILEEITSPDGQGEGLPGERPHGQNLACILRRHALRRDALSPCMLNPSPPCAWQSSMDVLPPPDQWGKNVLSYFNDMSADHHRMLLLDLRNIVVKLLTPAMTYGQGHSAYMTMIHVSSLVPPMNRTLGTFLSLLDRRH